MPEPVHDGLEDDCLLADVEAPGQPPPQVGVQHQEVALLHAAVEEGACTPRVRRQDELVEDGNPHVPGVGQSTRGGFRQLQVVRGTGRISSFLYYYMG